MNEQYWIIKLKSKNLEKIREINIINYYWILLCFFKYGPSHH